MTLQVTIDVRPEDFNLGEEVQKLADTHSGVGATVSFVGYVRDFSEAENVLGLELEHYPGMTEKSLQAIAEQAGQRWSLDGMTIIHRIGRLLTGEQIVLVVTASAHRGDAFAACEFVMDYLKVDAPFWKKEITAEGEHWVDAREGDTSRAQKWQLDD